MKKFLAVLFVTLFLLVSALASHSADVAKRPPNGKTMDTVTVAKAFESSHKKPPNGG